jgi:hypothetical protein
MPKEKSKKWNTLQYHSICSLYSATIKKFTFCTWKMRASALARDDAFASETHSKVTFGIWLSEKIWSIMQQQVWKSCYKFELNFGIHNKGAWYHNLCRCEACYAVVLVTLTVQVSSFSAKTMHLSFFQFYHLKKINPVLCYCYFTSSLFKNLIATSTILNEYLPHQLSFNNRIQLLMLCIKYTSCLLLHGYLFYHAYLTFLLTLSSMLPIIPYTKLTTTIRDRHWKRNQVKNLARVEFKKQ